MLNFDDDLDIFFDTDDFAITATYRRNGMTPGDDVDVILREYDVTNEFGGVPIVSHTKRIEVPVYAVPNPIEDDEFEINGVTYRVQARPRLDHSGRIWQVPVVDRAKR